MKENKYILVFQKFLKYFNLIINISKYYKLLWFILPEFLKLTKRNYIPLNIFNDGRCLIVKLCDTTAAATEQERRRAETLYTHMYYGYYFSVFRVFHCKLFFLLLFSLSVYTLYFVLISDGRRVLYTENTLCSFFYVSHFRSFWLLSYTTMLYECACFGELAALSFDV